MTPDELLKFEFHYTKSLYERGLLERLAEARKHQHEKENICSEEQNLQTTHPSDTDNVCLNSIRSSSVEPLIIDMPVSALNSESLIEI